MGAFNVPLKQNKNAIHTPMKGEPLFAGVQCRFNFVVFGESAQFFLGENKFSIHRYLEDSATGCNKFNRRKLGAETFEDLFRQTGGFAVISS